MSEVENTEATKMRWYVLQAFSGFENRVAVTLREYIKLHQMEDQFGEVLVPTEEVVESVGGRRRRTERKFFPGYVLVQMEMNDDTWHLVKSVPRVMGFIGGTADKPAPISKREADRILNRVQETAEKTASQKRIPAGRKRTCYRRSVRRLYRYGGRSGLRKRSLKSIRIYFRTCDTG